jgi:hypothetical protein
MARPRSSADIVTSPARDLDFTTPPECQGQIVEHAYAFDSAAMAIVERLDDRSLPSGSPERCLFRWYTDPKPAAEWEPQNGKPKLGDPLTPWLTRTEAGADA